MAGRERGVTGVEGVLKAELLEAIWVKGRWQRKFPVSAMEVPKREVMVEPDLAWWTPMSSYDSSHYASQ